MAQHKRRIQLINPSLQLKLCLIFLGLSLVCLMLQFTLVYAAITEIGMSSSLYGSLMISEISRVLWHRFLFTAAAAVPLTLFLGILVTFRIAGPVYRFERHLEAVIAGKNPRPCRVRNGDEFHELCTLINQVTLLVPNRSAGDALAALAPQTGGAGLPAITSSNETAVEETVNG